MQNGDPLLVKTLSFIKTQQCFRQCEGIKLLEGFQYRIVSTANNIRHEMFTCIGAV